MRDVNHERWEVLGEHAVPDARGLGEAADDLCQQALRIAKSQIHPLLENMGLNRLDQRTEFLQSFKSALEQGISQKLAIWQPGVQAVFKYEESPLESINRWDGSIHLLVAVPRLSKALHAMGKTLDWSLVESLRQLGWPRIRARQSVLEVQQVTLKELRYGIGYGAMFHAVYTAPVKVWPQEQRARAVHR